VIIDRWNRRRFMNAAAGFALAGTAPALHAAEPPPETRRIRLPRFAVDIACVSPMWIGEALLRAEGFDDVRYVPVDAADSLAGVVTGQTDFDMADPFTTLLQLDQGKPLVALGGIHSGCYELFGARGVRTIRDLKGRKVGYADAGRKAFIAAMLGNVRLDPAKDVTFVDTSALDGVRLLADGKIDAYLGFPPEPQELRAHQIGVSIVNTAIDRPWSQYFCCLAVGHRDFVARNPVATRRALRALVKAADLCAAEPERTVRTLVERGFVKHAEFAAQALREIPYRRWREYDSADSLRFYALRLHEVGALKSSPQQLLARGTEWRFIDQLKKELKS
jgi:NitT/TauT family transport system substrate-binding protein